MQITSNDDVNQLGIYAGVAGAGTVAGAAVVARATSPIYKKDKKSKQKDKALAESIAAPVTSPTSQKAVDRQRRGYRTETGAKKAEESAFARAADESRRAALARAESAAYDEAAVRSIFDNPQADAAIKARNQSDAMNHLGKMKRDSSQLALNAPGGSFLDAPKAHTGTIVSAPPSNAPTRRNLPGDSPNFRRTGSSPSGRQLADPNKQAARLLKIASKVR